jgi:molybdate transport system ATP-binding protein
MLRAVAGLDRAEGQVQLNGLSWQGAGAWIPPEQRWIGWVPQRTLIFPHLDVRGNLLAGSGRAKQAGVDTQKMLARVIELLELTPVLGRPVTTLSGGEARRISLGRALCSAPRLLLLDEPLSGLDLRLRRRVLTLIRRAQREFSIPTLIVSHDTFELQRTCDQLLVLRDGIVASRGEPQRLLIDPDLDLLGAKALDNILEGQLIGASDRAADIQVAEQVVLRTFPVKLPAGTPVQLEIRSRDIILAAQRPLDLSAQNILGGEVTAITRLGQGCLVHLRIGPQGPTLLATIGLNSRDRLGIQAGKTLYAIIKASAVTVSEM